MKFRKKVGIKKREKKKVRIYKKDIWDCRSGMKKELRSKSGEE